MTKAYCGLGKLKWPTGHPFNHICKWHDERYCKLDWKDKTVTTKQIDKTMFNHMVWLAGTDMKLIEDALFAYKWSRRWGKLRWALARIGIYPTCYQKSSNGS